MGNQPGVARDRDRGVPVGTALSFSPSWTPLSQEIGYPRKRVNSTVLSANVVGWSMYLLFNHPAVLGEDRTRSYVWNLGIVLYITLINATAIVYVMNQFGWWF